MQELDLEHLLDHSKITEMSKYHTTLKIVKPEEIRQGEYSMLDSAIEATKEGTRIGTINQQVQEIKNIQRAKTQEQNIEEKGEAKGE